MPITKTLVGPAPGGDVFLYTLRNEAGTEVRITNYGATTTAFIVRKEGEAENDIVLGFDDITRYWSADYLAQYPYMGAAIGRYANRIKGGRFTLNGKEYQLAQNLGNDHLHGGRVGFDRKVWTEVRCSEHPFPILELMYLSEDGEELYPGNLKVRIRFTLRAPAELSYEYTAESDADTIINLTHHSYFNLAHEKKDVSEHLLRIFGSHVLEQDADLCSTGKLSPVINSRFDFTAEKRISDQLSPGKDFDQGFQLDDMATTLKAAARVRNPERDLSMEILTTEPSIHLYTGNGFPLLEGKNGNRYGPYSGFCLETQTHANAINIPGFPDTVLRKGETYQSETLYRLLHS